MLRLIYDIPPSTISRYLKIITEDKIIDNVDQKFVSEIDLGETFITDSFTVKSMDGKDCTSIDSGRNSCDRGRKATKVHLIISRNGIPKDIDLKPANVHDSKILDSRLDTISFPNRVRLLADKAYVGKKLNKKALGKNVRLLVQPKKKRNKIQTHVLLKSDAEYLKKNRNCIELLNGQIRRHRGVMIKYLRKISCYRTLVLSVMFPIGLTIIRT